MTENPPTVHKAVAWQTSAVASSGQPAHEVYLHPGQTYASTDPAIISMILGSCVGVCLYDCQRFIGGATHYMLPRWDGAGQPSSRYGDVAIDTLLKKLESFGSRRKDLRAMIFGGASMFRAIRGGPMGQIGINNVNMATEVLSSNHITIATKDVGGERSRKLKLETISGVVYLTTLRSSQ